MGDQQEEGAESEVTDDDDLVEDDDSNLVTMLPHGELGREMRQLGLSDNVLRVQVHPTRLLINPERPLSVTQQMLNFI